MGHRHVHNGDGSGAEFSFGIIITCSLRICADNIHVIMTVEIVNWPRSDVHMILCETIWQHPRGRPTRNEQRYVLISSRAYGYIFETVRRRRIERLAALFVFIRFLFNRPNVFDSPNIFCYLNVYKTYSCLNFNTRFEYDYV